MVGQQLWRSMKMSQQEINFKNFSADYDYDWNRLSLSKNNLDVFLCMIWLTNFGVATVEGQSQYA